MFAKGERGEQIRKITLDPTTFIFEREMELIFVILTSIPEFEKLIQLILDTIKTAFLDQYTEEIKAFRGDLKAFTAFNAVVQNILDDYGYFDYVRLEDSFKTDDMLKCMLYINRETGEILFIKAKEYLDRKALSFQTTILLNSVNRVISEILHEEPALSILISQKSRCALIKATDKIIIVQEKQHPPDLKIDEIKMNDKKIRNFLKKPGKVIFETNERFIFFNSMGRDIVSNDRVGRFEGEELPPDVITLVNTSKKIMEGIYREQLSAILLFSEKQLYSAFMILDYYTFMQISMDDFKDFSDLFSKFKKCEMMMETNFEDFNHILKKIGDFKANFR